MSTALLERPTVAQTGTVVRLLDVNVLVALAPFQDLITDLEDFAFLFVPPTMGTREDRASIDLIASIANRVMNNEETVPMVTSMHILRTTRHKMMNPSMNFNGTPSHVALSKSEADGIIGAFVKLVIATGGRVLNDDEVRPSLGWAARTLPNDHEDTNVLAAAHTAQQLLDVAAWVQLVSADGDFAAYRGELLTHRVRADRPSALEV
jgi:hypothetical protein